MTGRGGVVVLIRHGESEWNRKNLFTGWVDVPLSSKGIEEALRAGEIIRSIPFAAVFVSALLRAQMTAFLALSRHDDRVRTPIVVPPQEESTYKLPGDSLPVYERSELNERMYGDLQGMNKEEARQQFGKEQVHIWRRSYDVPPPNGESLQDTCRRVLPYFQQHIVPYLQRGEHVFVSAHGNSLRAILMELNQLNKEEIVKVEVPTGKPLAYEWIENTWKEFPLS